MCVCVRARVCMGVCSEELYIQPVEPAVHVIIFTS